MEINEMEALVTERSTGTIVTDLLDAHRAGRAEDALQLVCRLNRREAYRVIAVLANAVIQQNRAWAEAVRDHMSCHEMAEITPESEFWNTLLANIVVHADACDNNHKECGHEH